MQEDMNMANKEASIYFHIGFQKVASTSLQLNLFSKHEQISHLGRIGSKPEFHQELIHSDYSSYSHGKCLEAWEGNNKILIKQGTAPVFSYENIAGLYGIDRTLVASRLKDLFPEAKIFMVIRNQLTWLASLYVHLLATKKIFGTYDEWIQGQFALRYNNFITHGNYWNIIHLYDELFSPDNVCVLLFEDLVNSPDVFSQQLSAFLDIDNRRTFSLLTEGKKYKTRPDRWSYITRRLPITETINRSVKKLGFVHKIIKNAIYMNQSIQPKLNVDLTNKLNAYYAPDNRLLSNRINRDLNKIGYPQ